MQLLRQRVWLKCGHGRPEGGKGGLEDAAGGGRREGEGTGEGDAGGRGGLEALATATDLEKKLTETL